VENVTINTSLWKSFQVKSYLGINPLIEVADGPGSKLFLCGYVTVWLWVSLFSRHFSFPSAKDSHSPKHEHY
jgi:hypothetical protein